MGARGRERRRRRRKKKKKAGLRAKQWKTNRVRPPCSAVGGRLPAVHGVVSKSRQELEVILVVGICSE